MTRQTHHRLAATRRGALPYALPYRVAAKLSLALCLLACAACQQRMADQPSYKPLEASDFFPDGRSARTPPAGTVARGHLRDDDSLYKGMNADGEPVTEFPFPITEGVLKRGKQRYEIFCMVCHGVAGKGDGRIVQRGFTKPPLYYPTPEDPEAGYSRYYELRGKKERLYDVPVGHLYDVITRGFGAMPDLHEQIPVQDRWAIVGYVRALQYSQSPEARKAIGKTLEPGGKKR